MIDWRLSNISQEKIKNKDRIIVVCEICLNTREQLYQVAKRKDNHICLSCAKSRKVHGYIKSGQIMKHICKDCGVEKDIKYRPDRFDNWRCHHCAMVQGHKEGKYKVIKNKPSSDGIKVISATAKKNWETTEYREKWRKSMDMSKDNRALVSKEIWTDSERLSRLSQSIKNLWMDEEYRTKKTQQSIEYWKSEEYRLKHREGMLKEDVRERMKIARDSQKKQVSNIQKMLYSYLTDLNVKFYEEGENTKL